MPQIYHMIKISKNLKVGVFAFAGIVVLFIGFNFMKGFDFLKSYTKYYIVYKNSAGVVKSTEVLINGFKIGQVEDVGFLNPGDPSKILVTIVVDGQVKMPKGTVAEIASSNILGNKVINIHLGNETEYIASKDTLIGKIEQDFSEIVAPIKEKSEQILTTLDKVFASMNSAFDSTGTAKLSKGIDNLSGTLANINNITSHLSAISTEQEKRVSAMFEHTESILRNLRNNNELIAISIKNVKQITDSIAASNLKSTINHVNTSLAEITDLIDKINKGEGTLGQLANNTELYTNLSSSSKELTSLLADMQKYPGRYFTVSVFGNSKRADKADKKREEDKKK